MKYFVPVFLFFLTFILKGQTCDPTTYDYGEATYYTSLDAGTPGHCSFKNEDVVPYYGALYTAKYDNASMCGVCAEVTGSSGTRIIQFVDECPTCFVAGDIDLGPQAFQEIVGDLVIGRAPISWHVVRCPWGDDPVKVITQGSNFWYAKVIISRHKSQLAKVEISEGNNWVTMARQVDNGWEGFNLTPGNNPHQLRITDVHGQSIVVDGIDLTTTDATFIGNTNFTGCVTTGNQDSATPVLKVFPNPAEEVVFIEGVKQGESWSLMDLDGQELQAGDAPQIDLSAFHAGVYVLRFSGGESRLVSKTD